MKKSLILLACTLMFFSFLFGCKKQEQPSGGTPSVVTGSVVYFCGDDGVIKYFSSSQDGIKEINLSKDEEYTLKFNPIFRGSQDVVYKGDVAEFTFNEENLEQMLQKHY